MSVTGEHFMPTCVSPSSSFPQSDSVLHRLMQLCYLPSPSLLVNSLGINWSLTWSECSLIFKIGYPLCKFADNNFDTYLLLQLQIHPPLLLQNLTVLMESSKSLPQLVTDQEVLVVYHCPVLIAKVSFIVVQPSAFSQDRKDHPQLLTRQP